jgi:hypothetical protein
VVAYTQREVFELAFPNNDTGSCTDKHFPFNTWSLKHIYMKRAKFNPLKMARSQQELESKLLLDGQALHSVCTATHGIST